MIVFRLAACCALAATACSDSIDPAAPREHTAPVVVRPGAWAPPTLSEAEILADRLLQRQNDRLRVDAAQRRELAAEILAVLSRMSIGVEN